MKKFIFSAVALMAISFSGMANEVKDDIKDDSVCVKVWLSQVKFYLSCGASEADALELADQGFAQCQVNTGSQVNP